MIDFVKVGEKIASCRRAMGLSQGELADRLFVTRQALSKWENGLSVPSVDTLFELCQLFGTSFEQLLCLDTVPVVTDPDRIFEGHDRGYILSAIANGELQVSLPDILWQLSPAERMWLLSRVRTGELSTDMETLMAYLTPAERHFMRGGRGVEAGTAATALPPGTVGTAGAH